MQSHTTADGTSAAISHEYLGPLLEFLAQQGISSAQLVQGTGLMPRALSTPGWAISATQYDQIFHNAVTLTADPLLGFEHGRRMSIATHGFLGFAVMASDSLGHGLSLAIRYAATRTGLADIRFVHQDGKAIIQVLRRKALPRSFPYIAHNILVTFLTIARFLTREELSDDVSVCLQEAPQQPEHYYRNLLDCEVYFHQEHYQLVLSDDLLTIPVSTANGVARLIAEQECERLLAATTPEALDLASRVRHQLQQYGHTLSLQDIARRLEVSPRTLNRQLAQLNTSLRQLTDEVRKEYACHLLSATQLKIEEIAGELSYTDTSNFVRAFRRWVGVTPLAFRKMTKSVV